MARVNVSFFYRRITTPNRLNGGFFMSKQKEIADEQSFLSV